MRDILIGDLERERTSLDALRIRAISKIPTSDLPKATDYIERINAISRKRAIELESVFDIKPNTVNTMRRGTKDLQEIKRGIEANNEVEAG